MGKNVQLDLFGEESIRGTLRDRYIEPPFSVLDTKGKEWMERKRKWINLGLKSELGRDSEVFSRLNLEKFNKKLSKISIFDATLCEVMYHWFCPSNGKILDPFAGGSVRGIVANYLDYQYTGIDIRKEQVDANIKQLEYIKMKNNPEWIVGDSNVVLDTLLDETFDMVFSCPPYADLEVYSDLEGDISNMEYNDFIKAYRSIVAKSCAKLKPGGYAVFVVGEVRDKKGYYYGFVPDTISAFVDAGLKYYNEMVLVNCVGTAPIRAETLFGSSKKIIKLHQNVLCFKKC